MEPINSIDKESQIKLPEPLQSRSFEDLVELSSNIGRLLSTGEIEADIKAEIDELDWLDEDEYYPLIKDDIEVKKGLEDLDRIRHNTPTTVNGNIIDEKGQVERNRYTEWSALLKIIIENLQPENKNQIGSTEDSSSFAA